jgi:3'-5' exoribonuclease
LIPKTFTFETFGKGERNLKKIAELRLGDVAQGFFLIKEIECKTSTNNKKYLDITLADRTGEINAKFWDFHEPDEQYASYMLVKVRGQIVDWQNRLQYRIEKIRPATHEDGLNIEDFISAAPEKPEDMYHEVIDYIDKIINEDIQKIVKYIVLENREKLLIYPAAQKNHHAIRSGLLYHIKTMLLVGEELSKIYPVVNRDLLFAGIILHDIAKINEMNVCSIGLITDYTVEGQLLGHIVQGIKIIEQVAHKLKVNEEISLLLQHMLLSHHYEPEFGSPKRPMIPEAELLHYIDIIDARMYDMEKILGTVKEEQFSDRIWLLHNRRLYKHSLSHNKDKGEFDRENNISGKNKDC